ncbi:hypothetical protein HXX76_001651 [Chlamydomonas incerta]|uniref:Uncharacterized protein n=1 Tax=Chlamydomonas incerta TaxID=51695 RepID=A0A835WCW1_CHLIN|nr:hypothetical protein HXX76_001651 [Chlamydomonas incerta]|eukprot:KAG2444915.1 hypothetical protein HXX76_001651 [Chlamydomonas incerta]
MPSLPIPIEGPASRGGLSGSAAGLAAVLSSLVGGGGAAAAAAAASAGTNSAGGPSLLLSPAQHAAQAERQAAFAALRPLTTQLLVLREQPERLAPALAALRDALGPGSALPPGGVAACWDYVAFPLLILVDAVLPTRQQQAPQGGQGGQGQGAAAGAGAGGEALTVAACRSDRVVEALLGCVEALLQRCPDADAASPAAAAAVAAPTAGAGPAAGGEVRQLVVLQRLAPLLTLRRDAASEEVHLGLQRCVAAALQPLAAAAVAGQAHLSNEGGGQQGQQGRGEGRREQEAGSSGGPLCGEAAAPLAGYLVHCCLEAAEREVLAGHKGSKALCAGSLTSLRLLVEGLSPDADSLAFFLPGVMSGLAKVLVAGGAAASRSGPSAPPGAAALVQALGCLRAATLAVLSDRLCAPILAGRSSSQQQQPSGSSGALVVAGAPSSADDALSALRALSLAAAAPQPAAPHGDAPPAPPPLPHPGQPQSQPPRRLRVHRTAGWLEDTAQRLASLLGRALPPLASHPRPAVRAELGATAAALLDGCGQAAAPVGPLLLRLVFTLAQDEWASVSAPCMAWVARRAAPPPPPLSPPPALLALPPPPPEASVPQEGGAGGELVPAVGPPGPAPAAREAAAAAALRGLEDEFERFMAELAADSVLLAEPELRLDDGDEFGGGGGGGGGGAGVSAEPTAEALAVPAEAPAAGNGGASRVAESAGPDVDAGSAGTGAGAPAPAPPAVAAPPPRPPPLPGLQQLIEAGAGGGGLLRAVRCGEAEAVVSARCLTTALLVAGPGAAAEWLLLRPAALAELLGALFRCFAFDRTAAPLVLHLRGEAGAYGPPPQLPAAAPSAAAPSEPSGTAPAPAPAPSGLEGGAGTAKEPAVAAAAAAAAAAGGCGGGGATAVPELPRMPLGLLHLASQRSYAAVAGVARALGWLARRADLQQQQQQQQEQAQGQQEPREGGLRAGFLGGAAEGGAGAGAGAGSAFRRLVEELVAAVRSASSSAASAGRGGAGAGPGGAGGGGGGPGAAHGSALEGSWQLETAAVVAVAAEVVIGASNAWTPPVGLPSAADRAADSAADAPPAAAAHQSPAAAAQPVASPSPPPPPGCFPAADPGYEGLLGTLLDELMRPRIAKLATHNTIIGSSSSSSSSNGSSSSGGGGGGGVGWQAGAAPRALGVQELGENVMLLRVAVEAVGGAARAAGPAFAQRGRLLRRVLLPLLELLGDPCAPVAAAADTALLSVAAHCGYGGSLRALVGGNADYVVEGLCAALRDLQRHPRAPYLLAALLRRAGVAPQLLPIMAEPLQRALQGVSILARHWSPQHTAPYLAALRELAAGAAEEAAAAAADSRAAVAELNRAAAEARDREERELDELVNGSGPGAPPPGDGAASTASTDAAAEPPAERARRYFHGRAARSEAAVGPNADAVRERRRRRAAAAAAAGAAGGAEGAPIDEGEDEDEDDDMPPERRPLLVLTAGQLEDGELRFRRLHAAAVVAGAAADAASPLLMSGSLAAAVSAAEVLRAGLGALGSATPCVEAEAAVLEEYGGLEGRMRPVRPETPKVLPAVAACWPPLMAALRDSRTPVVERGVAAVAELVEVAGGMFLARRFQTEAWPVLQRLLAAGTAHTPGLLSLGTDAVRPGAAAGAHRQRLALGLGGGGGGGGAVAVVGGEDASGALAPAAVARVQVAVLGCLEAVCRCRDATAAVRTLTWDIAQAALPFLASSSPAPLAEAARRALTAVAGLDPDSVWLLLYDTASNIPAAVRAAAAAAAPAAGCGPASPTGAGSSAAPEGTLPSGAGAVGFGARGSGGVAAPPALPQPPVPPGPEFPPLRALLPSLPAAGRHGAAGRVSYSGVEGASAAGAGFAWPVTAALAAECGPRAQALLGVVAGGEVPWHKARVPALELLEAGDSI